MNRSTIYDYLKNVADLRALFYRLGKGYYTKFVPTIWTRFSQITINDMYIEGFYSIILCASDIIIEDEMGNMEVHIKYRDIEYIDVIVE